jgi:ribose/xylose/arabinose/galactoside ABC-type transport system permease subunit
VSWQRNYICRQLPTQMCIFARIFLLKWKNIVTYEGFAWLIITGSGWIIGFIGTYLQLQPIITSHSAAMHGFLRLAPFLTGLRVSSLLRDWLGSDLRVSHFFSFSCPLVNTHSWTLNSLTTALLMNRYQSLSRSYFATGGSPPISSSWRQVPWDPRAEIFSTEILR